MSSPKSLVIYTCLTGDKEALGNPLKRLVSKDTDLDLRFVCFSDRTDLTSEIWQIVTFDTLGLPAAKSSRLPKALPHVFFSNLSDYSLYIDNTVEFRRLPNSEDLSTSSAYLFKLFRHSGRESLAQEAAAIAALGFETSDRLMEQLEHYASLLPLEDIAPLSTCTLLLRQHSHPAVKRQGEFWWAQILAYSRRDQMSFDFSRIQTNCDVEYLEGTKHENTLIYAQANFSASRVLANFDEKRYQWNHRHVMPPITNAKRHFLDQSADPGKAESYQRRDNDPLNIYCHLFGSSLGSSISPRRNISQQIFNPLKEYLDPKTSLGLGVRVGEIQSDDDFSEDDFQASCKALREALEIPEFRVAHFSRESFHQVTVGLSKLLATQFAGLVFIAGLDSRTELPMLRTLIEGVGISLRSVSCLIAFHDEPNPFRLGEALRVLEEGFNKKLKHCQLLATLSDAVTHKYQSKVLVCCFSMNQTVI
jgi:hypothetical protein